MATLPLPETLSGLMALRSRSLKRRGTHFVDAWEEVQEEGLLGLSFLGGALILALGLLEGTGSLLQALGALAGAALGYFLMVGLLAWKRSSRRWRGAQRTWEALSEALEEHPLLLELLELLETPGVIPAQERKLAEAYEVYLQGLEEASFQGSPRETIPARLRRLEAWVEISRASSL